MKSFGRHLKDEFFNFYHTATEEERLQQISQAMSSYNNNRIKMH
ncbi:hypothetical protein ACVQ8P_01005 [Dellaglioa sp. BT-FLS60]